MIAPAAAPPPLRTAPPGPSPPRQAPGALPGVAWPRASWGRRKFSAPERRRCFTLYRRASASRCSLPICRAGGGGGGEDWGGDPEAVDALDVVLKAQQAVFDLSAGHGGYLDPTVAVVARGKGRMLGLKVSADIAWSPASGAFRERLSAAREAVSCASGYMGEGGAGKAWQVDLGGAPSPLQLEDREAALLSAWFRTGQWLQPAGLENLEVAVDAGAGGKKGDVVLVVKLKGGQAEARVGVSGRSWLPRSLDLPVAGGTERWILEDWKEFPLPHGSVKLPRRTKHVPTGGGENTYKIDQVEAGPFSDVPAPHACPGWEGDPFRCPMALPGEEPHGDGEGGSAGGSGFCGVSSVDTSRGVEVPAARGEGGHILLRPLVNGQDVGWWVLDTGCSSLAITPQACAKLGLAPSFGEQRTPGLGGAAVVSAFRRADALSLGPVSLEAPLLTELSLDGAVRGAGDGAPVAGVLGYSLLHACTVHVSAPKRQPGSTEPPKVTATVYPAHGEGSFVASPRLSLAWQGLEFVGCEPHLSASFCVEDATEVAAPVLDGPSKVGGAGREGEEGEEGQEEEEEDVGAAVSRGMLSGDSESEGRFKLGLGVGGTGVVLSSRVARRMQVLRRIFPLTPGGVISGTGSAGAETDGSARLQPVEGSGVATARLSWLELAGARFDMVRALVHTGGGEDEADLQISTYAAGIICADLLRGCELVLDYPRARAAVVTVQPDIPE